MKQKVHIVSIGNDFMADLAITLKEQNYEITGSDNNLPESLYQKLTDWGIHVNTQWKPEEINQNIDYIVLAAHVNVNNPEIQKAKELNLNIVSIPEFIYDRTKNKTRVVIAGSKGKRNVLSMLMYALKKQNIHFDYVLSKPIPSADKTISLHYDSRIAIIEGDEYISSPLNKKYNLEFYRPHIAIVTNIFWKNSEKYPLKENYLNVFFDFIKSIERDGKLIYNEADENINQILSKGIREDITAMPASVHETIESEKDVLIKTRFGNFPVKIINPYFLQNLNSARYACRQLGIQDKDFYSLISEYSFSV